jgi:hypothetical protein
LTSTTPSYLWPANAPCSLFSRLGQEAGYLKKGPF